MLWIGKTEKSLYETLRKRVKMSIEKKIKIW